MQKSFFKKAVRFLRSNRDDAANKALNTAPTAAPLSNDTATHTPLVSAPTGETSPAEKTHQTPHHDVLLLEDDFVCAKVVLQFFRTVGLTCRHVQTVAEARKVLAEEANTLRLIMADHFLSDSDTLSKDNQPETGISWLTELKATHPHKSWTVAHVLVSGHTDLDIGQTDAADLILKKPWKPGDLLAFLRQRNLLPA